MVDIPAGAFLLDEREIAAFATSPAAVASYQAIQNAAFNANPQSSANAQEAAEQALVDAASAQSVADAAVADAATKLDETAADALYVKRDQSPAWSDPTGTLARASYATYTAPAISAIPTQAEVQAIANHVQILSQTLAALVTDARAINALT